MNRKDKENLARKPNKPHWKLNMQKFEAICPPPSEEKNNIWHSRCTVYVRLHFMVRQNLQCCLACKVFTFLGAIGI
jgi:hypothetical protein